MHPLDPLSAHELEKVVQNSKIAWDLKPHNLFAMVQLNEPDKETLLSNKAFERIAKVTVLDTPVPVPAEISAATFKLPNTAFSYLSDSTFTGPLTFKKSTIREKVLYFPEMS